MTIAPEAISPAVHRDPRELISRDLYVKLVARVMEDERVSQGLAQRIIKQTLAFLKACADQPGRRLSPTKAVDPGWHAFILHTEDYAVFCQRVAGAFIHHRPADGGDTGSGSTLARTVAAVQATGYPLDPELWAADEADCSQCHAGCHHSP